MRFEFLQKNDTPLWDEFVAKSPQGSIFSTSSYLDALQVEYRIGVLTNQGGIVAGIVLPRNELRAYSNPLLVKYLGVLFEPLNDKTKYVTRVARERKIGNALVEHLSRYRSFDYTFHPAFTNWLPFYWAGFRQEGRYTYVLRDISSMDTVLDGAASRVRKALRKADNNGVKVVEDVDVASFYEINNLSFQRQGGEAPYSLEKLTRLYNALSGENSIHLLGAVDHAGRLVAVAGVVNDRHYSYLLFNGSDYRLPDVGANTKLIVETIRYCSALAPGFDFEGSMIREIEFFYQAFGAEQVPYYCIWRDNALVGGKRKLIKLYKKLKYGRKK